MLLKACLLLSRVHIAAHDDVLGTVDVEDDDMMDYMSLGSRGQWISRE